MMLKVMQVGYGYWGANISRKLLQSNMFEYCVLCENDAEQLKKARTVLPKRVCIIEDYREALKEKEIQAVVIATQTEISYQIAMDALDAGMHVFIEKPIATTVERAKMLNQKAMEKERIIHCDHLMLYNPIIRYIKKMMDDGELGELLYIDVSRVNLGPIRKDVNAMLDLAVHDIAVIDYFMDGLEPERLSAFGTAPFGKQETLTYLTMKYGKLIAHINSSWVSPVKVRRTLIGGTKKMVVFDDVKTDKLRIYNRGIDVVQSNEYGKYEFETRVGDLYIPHIEQEDSLQNSLEHFAICVNENKPSFSGPKQSLRVMKVLERAQEELKKNSV